jgi:hypothetical protein
VNNESWSQFLRRFSARLAVRITEGVAPLFNGALAYLQDLKVYCPEAFDADGNLRPDWQQIVRARLAEMQPAKTPEFHCELITRKKVVNLN